MNDSAQRIRTDFMGGRGGVCGGGSLGLALEERIDFEPVRRGGHIKQKDLHWRDTNMCDVARNIGSSSMWEPRWEEDQNRSSGAVNTARDPVMNSRSVHNGVRRESNHV